MKKIVQLLIVGCMISPYLAFSQKDTSSFWLTTKDGASGEGALVRVYPDLVSASEVFTFPESDPGRSPYGFPIEGPDGFLYGVTAVGGANDRGAFFRYSEQKDSMEYLCVDFGSDSLGDRPFWSPVYAGTDKIFGLCYDGGANGLGTLFSYDWNQNTFQIEYQFNSAVGGLPFSRPVVSNDGKFLYIFCQSGGISNSGTIARFNMATGAMVKLFDFQGQILSGPRLTPWLTPDNVLYGVTLYGGNAADGGMFKYDLNSGVYTHLTDLSYGGGPNGKSSAPILIGNKLYAASWNGGDENDGCIYVYDLDLDTAYNLISFSSSGNPVQGYYPRGNLYLSADSMLYGMFSRHRDTVTQSSKNLNTIYKFNPKTNEILEEYLFSSFEGGDARNGLNGINGHLYGMSTFGGSAGSGTLFKYNKWNKSLEVLHSFRSYPNGRLPEGQLIELVDGRLIGRLSSGGKNGEGGMFSYDLVSKQYNLFHSYSNDETHEGSDFIEHSSGKYFRTTRQNGDSLYGSIQEFDPNTMLVQDVLSFHENDSFGYESQNELLELPDGRILVITDYSNFDDKDYWGFVFTYDPKTKGREMIADWNQDSLGGEQVQLLLAPDGKVYYHAAYYGPFDLGAFGVIDLNSKQVTVLEDFTGKVNAEYAGRIFFNSDSTTIYCTKENGGVDPNTGGIYSYSITTNTFSYITEPNALQGSLEWNKPYRLNDTAWLMLLSEDSQNAHQGAIASWDGLGNGPAIQYAFTGIEVNPWEAQMTRICDNFNSKAFISLKPVTGDDYIVQLPANAGNFEVAVGNGPFSSNKLVSLQNGTQTIRVRSVAGCIVSKETLINVGLADQEKIRLNAYPNPSNGLLTAESESDIMGIQVFSITGKLVHQDERHGRKLILDLQELDPGLYLLQCTLGSGNEATIKVLIQ